MPASKLIIIWLPLLLQTTFVKCLCTANPVMKFMDDTTAVGLIPRHGSAYRGAVHVGRSKQTALLVYQHTVTTASSRMSQIKSCCWCSTGVLQVTVLTMTVSDLNLLVRASVRLLSWTITFLKTYTLWVNTQARKSFISNILFRFYLFLLIQHIRWNTFVLEWHS